MNPWLLTYKNYDPEEVGLREALCTLANGYFSLRGANEGVKASDIHYPGTYLAGCYNTLTTQIENHTLINEDLVNTPNPLLLQCRAQDGIWLDVNNFKPKYYQLQLNMHKGILSRKLEFQDQQGRITKIKSTRLASMHHPHLAAIKYEITALNWSGTLIIKSSIDSNVKNQGVARYKNLNNQHLKLMDEGELDDLIYLLTQTTQSQILIATTARTQIFQNQKKLNLKPNLEKEQQCLSQIYKIQIQQKKPIILEKIISIYHSKDFAISHPLNAAIKTTKSAGSFADLLKQHTKVWQQLWQNHFIKIQDKRINPRALNFNIFHSLQTLSKHSIDLDYGAPARGLHGEAYRGHVFWDELFILPFFNLHTPNISRALLLYRYRRINAAKENAKAKGLKGALFPWQSASEGTEASQQWHLNPLSNTWGPDYSSLQIHINAAISYNIWNYYQHTQDQEFLINYGLEILIEIARLFASMATFNSKKQRYEINNVVGPDEYHEQYPNSKIRGINNNAYTNIMAAWSIKKAIEVLELTASNQVPEKELKLWKKICTKMFIPMHKNIIMQFEGFEKLKPFPWQEYKNKYTNIERLDRILKSEGQNPNDYQISKQADTLMLFYLFPKSELKKIFKQLGYKLKETIIKNTIDYYLRCTSHGSTLSKLVFADVLNESHPKLAQKFFQETLIADLADTQKGSTKEGIHLGAMTGSIIHIIKQGANHEHHHPKKQPHPHLRRTPKNRRIRTHVHLNQN